MQTSYSYAPAAGYAGLIADSRNATVTSKVNPVVAIPYGVAVCKGVDPDRDVKLPTTAAEASACLGVAASSQSQESSASGAAQYPVLSAVPVLEEGAIFVVPEEAVTPASRVFVRYTTGIADSALVQKGAFRASPDGTAQVTTLTPTAANSTIFGVSIFDKDGKLLKTAQVTSDADGTATEICDALRTALGTVPGITLSGTATLVITASVAGDAFSVSTYGAGVMAVVATTANAQSAAELKGVKYETSVSAGAPVKLIVSKPAA